MNQPPGSPTGRPPYPGQSGSPQGQPPAAVQAPKVGLGGTMVMPASPQQAQAQALALAAQQRAASAQQPPPGAPVPYGAPPPGAPVPYGAPPPGAPVPYGAPPPGAPFPYGAPPPGAAAPYGAPPPGYGQPPQGATPYGAPPAAPLVPGSGAPGAPFGAASPPVQPQGSGFSVGFGGLGPGGIPRVKIGEGDFNPNKLWKAVISGEGYAKPRLFGATMLGLSIALTIVNVVLMLVLHLYYPYFYSLGAVIGWAGLWMVVTGQPKAPDDSGKAPMWGRAGLAACLVVGVLVGIAMIFLNWEAYLIHR